MKNYHKCWIAALLFSSSLSMPVKLLAQGTQYNKKDPNNYEHAYIPVKAYKTGADLFRKLFRVDSQNVNVTFLENETFEVTSFDAIQRFKSLVASESEDTLEAFEIKYGLRYSEGKYKLVNIYTPLKLVVTYTSQNPAVVIYSLPDNVNTSLVTNNYIIEAKKFDTLSKDSANTWIRNYQDLIKIDEKNINSFRRYIGGATGDAEGQIFGFKEIEHFFKQGDDIYLTSWTNIDLRNGIPTFRHSVAMANGAYNGDLTNVHAADLGTMCPPNCLKMIFRDGRTEGKKIFQKNIQEPIGKTDTPKFEKQLTWILITIGSLLIGFIIGRLAKRK